MMVQIIGVTGQIITLPGILHRVFVTEEFPRHHGIFPSFFLDLGIELGVFRKAAPKFHQISKFPVDKVQALHPLAHFKTVLFPHDMIVCLMGIELHGNHGNTSTLIGFSSCSTLRMVSCCSPLGKVQTTLSPWAYPMTASPMGARTEILLVFTSLSLGMTNWNFLCHPFLDPTVIQVLKRTTSEGMSSSLRIWACSNSPANFLMDSRWVSSA